MREDFVARLGAQLTDAAEREARRGPVRRAGRAAGWNATSPRVVAVAAMLLALVVAVAAVQALQDDAVPPAGDPLRVVSRTELVGQGGWVTSGFGAVWAADAAASEVLRIDPATRRVVARFPAGAQPVATVAGEAVWILAGTRLAEVDPATNRVTARIPLPESARTPGGVIAGRGAVVWAVNALELLRIDARRNVVDRRIELAGDGFQAGSAVGDGRLVYVGRGDGRLLAFDAATGARVAGPRTSFHGFLFAARDGVLLGGTAEGVVALEAGSGRVLWTQSVGGQRINDAVLGSGGVVWVHGTDARTNRDRISRVDARTGRLRGSVQMPEFGVTRLAAVGDRVWVVSPDGTLVIVE